MTTDERLLGLDEIEVLARDVLLVAGTDEGVAPTVARSIRRAEADGIRSHGLARLATYAQHVRIGKVDGSAKPSIGDAGSGAVIVDARCGFAHPAIDLGIPELINRAKKNAIAILAITNSYNCGVVGHHVEAIADAGLVTLGFVNAPTSIAPWGGRTPVFGTNPIAFAAPRRNLPSLVIDQSSSVVARGEIMVHAQQGRPIPEGWAITSDGKPTTDPEAALKGSLLPSGGYKGAGLALIVEIMAAVLTGANLSIEASSFADNNGGPPKTGQAFIAIDIGRLSDTVAFGERLEHLFSAMTSQPDVRLPGDKRLDARRRTATEGVWVPLKLLNPLIDQSRH
jgi:(2R)-3-sulfolactate dehydrogenase (NADP+)